MILVYAQEEIPLVFNKSIFLAGPTPTHPAIPSWRPSAILELLEAGYEGVVFIPEPRNGLFNFNYDCQVQWEKDCIRASDVVAFWIPRCASLIGLTTNTEYGWLMNSGKILFGAPENAEHVAYQQWHARDLGIPKFSSLRGLMKEAVEFVSKGALRKEGERFIPQMLWHTDSFQSWYQSQKRVSNVLKDANVEMIYRVGAKKNFIFCWVAHVSIYVAAEKRMKSNEIVISRPDIASVLLYRKGDSLEQTEVVLVKEFRSPVNNGDGFVWELPSGSDRKTNEWQKVAQSEVHEEVGLLLDAGRFQKHECRQLAATFSAHKSTLFSCELTEQEMSVIKADNGKMRGNNVSDSEQTYAHVVTVGSLLNPDFTLVDWTTLGMILSALNK